MSDRSIIAVLGFGLLLLLLILLTVHEIRSARRFEDLHHYPECIVETRP